MTTSRAWTAACVTALMLVLSSVPSHALPPTRAIQPGAELESPVGFCTMNFVFTFGATMYIGTAGHCGSVGARVKTNNVAFGTIVYSRNDATIDFALIQIDGARLGDVEPSVRAWGGPTGATDESETAVADEVLVYGYGILVGELEPTRGRQGVLVSDSNTSYQADMPAVNGDSGGPILHASTGKALGIVSRYGFGSLPPTTDAGPTVEHILRTLSSAGFPVTLVTAAF